MKKREPSFDMLRIIAMMMIICLHYLVKGNLLMPVAQDLSGKNLILWLIEALCICAVNVYILLSGYLLVDASWKPGKVFCLLGTVYYYLLLIPVLLWVTGSLGDVNISLYGLLEYVFPVASEQYWFMTSYILMYLLMPVLSNGLRQMTKRQLEWMIGFLLFFFSVEKSCLPIAISSDHAGYDFGWFLVLFTIAAYCRLYGIPFLQKKKGRNGLILYLISVLLIWGISITAAVLGEYTGIAFFKKYTDIPYHYNYLLCLSAALGLFYYIKEKQFSYEPFAKGVCAVGPLTLGVYLLHEHPMLRYEWPKMLHVDASYSAIVTIYHMFLCVAVIFVSGILAEFVRVWIVRACEQRLRNQKK